MRNNIAVFASGNGSNFQSLVDAEKNGALAGTIKLLVSDKPQSFVIERAKKEQIPFYSFNPKEFDSKDAYESLIVNLLREKEIDLIILAGYMRLVGKTLLTAFSNKIINLHPSLLPSFPGKDAIGQALNYGVKYTGVTVHFVDEGMDTGPIIQQKVIPIDQDETIDSLTNKVHKIEHALLLDTVNLLLNEK